VTSWSGCWLQGSERANIRRVREPSSSIMSFSNTKTPSDKPADPYREKVRAICRAKG